MVGYDAVVRVGPRAVGLVSLHEQGHTRGEPRVSAQLAPVKAATSPGLPTISRETPEAGTT